MPGLQAQVTSLLTQFKQFNGAVAPLVAEAQARGTHEKVLLLGG